MAGDQGDEADELREKMSTLELSSAEGFDLLTLSCLAVILC